MKRWLGVLVILAPSACGAKHSGFDASIDQPDGCEHATVPVIRWTTTEPGTSQVEYGPDATYGYATPISSEPTTEHEVLLAGLPAGREWHWRAISDVASGRIASGDHTVETCAANEDLPELTVRRYDPTRTELGWLVGSVLAQKSYVMVFNRDGDYVWWHYSGDKQIVSRARLAANGGDILYIQANQDHRVDEGAIVRVSLTGEELVRTRTPMSHHDFVELPSGNFLYIRADVRNVPIDTAVPATMSNVVGDTLVEVAPNGTIVREVWSTWNDFSPIGYVDPATDMHFYPQGLDWTHCNSVIYSEADAAIFLSCKHISTIVKIDFQTGEHVWYLGGDFSDFELTAGPGFIMQHSVSRTPNGIMLFNNRANVRDEFGLWSEAAAFELDETAMTYRRVWSYDADKQMYTFLMGDSDYTPNGNIATSWGIRGVVMELTPGSDVVWDVASSVGSGFGYTSWIQSIGPIDPE